MIPYKLGIFRTEFLKFFLVTAELFMLGDWLDNLL